MSVPVSRSLVRAVVALVLAPALALSGLLVGSTAHAQKIKPDFWGMHSSDWSKNLPVPVGSANFTTAATYWTSIEPTKGSYNWAKLDQQVACAEKKGAKPMIVLGRTPRHASPKPASDDYADYMPSMAAWKGYVTQVVQRYGARLDYQIWPEPNIVENWKGSPRQMAKLTAAASKIIKKKSPRAKVVSPALTLRLEQQRIWMVKYFKQSVGGKRIHRYVDVVALDTFPEQAGKPEDSFKLMKLAKRQLANIGVRGVAFWNNEINYGVQGGFQDTDTQYPVDVQQAYVIRTYALSAAAGMQRTYWLSWYFPTNTMGIKMSEADGTALPPAKSYTVVRSWLNQTRFGSCNKKSGIWMCTAQKGSGKRLEVRRIYWKPSGRATTIKTPQSTKRVEDQEGGKSTRRGARKIRVDYRPIMVASRK